MFRMNDEDEKLLNREHQTASARRQKIYKYIKEHPTASSNVELATAAGYDMNTVGSSEYLAGSNFVSNLIRKGYIDKCVDSDGARFYLTKKETAKAIVNHQPTYWGSITINSTSFNNISISFTNKSQGAIAEMINELKLQEIL